MKRVTLIFLGQTGAGPVYSLEMAKALASNRKCELQVIVSDNISNLQAWKNSLPLINNNVHLSIVKTYNHSNFSVFIQFFNFYRKAKIVKQIRVFAPDVLYVPFGLMWSRFIYLFIPSQIRIIRTIHDVKSHDVFNLAESISSLLIAGSKYFIDGYVILNEKDKSIVQNKYKKPVAVIPHASFGYYFGNNTSTNQKCIKYKIGFFGRIEPYKGLDLLIDAFEQSRTVGLKLLIAGSGSIDSSLLERLQSNKNIELINRYILDEEFQTLLDKVDFVVLPYKRASQSGVIPMCFAYGKTVIATNVGALSEQIPDGTGILTSPDAESIALQIDTLYSNSELLLEYGQSAYKYAKEYLTWERSAKTLLDFIETLMK